MASGPGGSDITGEDLAGLTDGELIAMRRSLIAEGYRLRIILTEGSADMVTLAENLPEVIRLRYSAEELERQGLSRPLTDQETRFVECHRSQFRIEIEMNSRLSEMLRGARIALGLTFREVARVAGTHSKFVDEIEQGRRGGSGSPGVFEGSCTENGLEGLGNWLRQSVWFPLADPRFCRTIPRVAVVVEPDWLARNSGSARDLARLIFRDQALHLLPILGDALEEAGCVDLEILTHCRNPGPHARGCWLVDALVRAARPG